MALWGSGACGCTSLPEYVHNGFKVGPNFKTPPAPVGQEWIDTAMMRPGREADDLSKWWTVFDDPVLNDLICYAYKQNLTLREAAFRILQARAQYKIACGELFPQTQQAYGDYNRTVLSKEVANVLPGFGQRSYSQFDFGMSMAWEIDFWGRLRRGIEYASDNLDASVHDYEDVLVTLLSDVASNYINLRTTEKRIRYAEKNVELQREVFRQVDAREQVGGTTKVGVYQAEGLMWQTDAQINLYEISLRQSNNQLCILLGIPPEELRKKIGYMPPVKNVTEKNTQQGIRIPQTPDPKDVAVGIPANLLARRPDVRRALSLAAAQSAQIGIAEAELYPTVSILGTIGVSAEHFKDLFRPLAYDGTIGPTFRWNILNYGRLLNNVRFQDAKFQELVAAYQQSVLNGQLEVENGLVSFLQSREQFKKQEKSVIAAEAAQKLVLEQFKAGTVNIAQLILFQQNLVLQQDTLAVAEGNIALGLVQVYKGLGGGWELRRTGCDISTVSLPSSVDCAVETRPVFLPPVEAELPAPRDLKR